MSNLTMNVIQEKQTELEEGREKLEEAISIIERALMETPFEKHADAYLLGHLRGWVDGCGSDTSVVQYIEQLGNMCECAHCKYTFEEDMMDGENCYECQDDIDSKAADDDEPDFESILAQE